VTVTEVGGSDRRSDRTERRTRRWRRSIAGVALVGALTAGAIVPATATVPHTVVVSEDPVNDTPHVLDGRVNAVVQLGDRVIVGGNFSQVRRGGTTQTFNRRNVFAFSASSGAIDQDFTPNLDGVVEEAVAHPDGQHVFLVGDFNTVNGQTRRKVVLLDASDGSLVNAFEANASSRVLTAAVAGGRLFIGGHFSGVNGVARDRFAAVDVATGDVDEDVDVPFTVPVTGSVSVRDLDLTPDGRTLVAIGNFTRVGGQARNQVAVLDIGPGGASVSPWFTNAFEPPCSGGFDSIMRSMDVAPDGSYFVIGTTGAYQGGPPKLCDTITRWPLQTGGGPVSYEWAAYTGGDTTYTVLSTGAAVYVGGHMRWMNNPYAGDRQGVGAVPREGIAALDPENGLPYSWNPGRDRGVGVFDFLSTPTHLWVGSDTDRLGGEFHARLGALPVAGGRAAPPPEPYPVPGKLYAVRSNGSVHEHAFTGLAAGPGQEVPGLSLGTAQGAFALEGRIYNGTSGGTFLTRTFDGSNDGPTSTIDLRGLEVAPGRTIAGTSITIPGFDDHLAKMTGMFWTDGFLYYTVSGQPHLYARAFTVESRVVGTELLLADQGTNPVPWRRVRGMAFANDRVYYAKPNGSLWTVGFVDGQATGTATKIGGPGIDGTNWASRAMFIFPT
jgi:hypothetical protein